MKETFVQKVFTPAHEKLIVTAEEIMDRYTRSGYDLSLRQLYYQFVAHHGLPNREQSYKMLCNVISDARDAGRLDWNRMVDRGRTPTFWAKYDDPTELIRTSRDRYAVDFWKDQSHYVELMVEKQALEGVLEPVASRYQVPFNANKGYSSSSAIYRAAKRLAAARRDGKDPVVIYLGDHDPSGIDMSRDVEDRLQLYSRGYVKVVRVALNMDQVEQYEPPPNPTKLSDSRAEGYISQFGDDCWELDALDPDVLDRLASVEICKHIDRDQWQLDRERLAKDLGDIDRLVEAYDDEELTDILGESHPAEVRYYDLVDEDGEDE